MTAKALDTPVNDKWSLIVKGIRYYKDEPIADVIIANGVVVDAAMVRFASDQQRAEWAERHARSDATAEELNEALTRLSIEALKLLGSRERKPTQADQLVAMVTKPQRPLVGHQVASAINAM